MGTVFLNGEYLPREDACISVEDRGFLLADGVYEVTAAYDGRLVWLDRHLARLRRGLDVLRIEVDLGPLPGVHERLLEENGLEDAPYAKVYLQVTRGPAVRTHAFPGEATEPTVFAAARRWSPPEPAEWEEGFSAVTVPDRRGSRSDVKTIALVANVLAQQTAVDAGADEAILVREGVAIEGAHANLWAVRDGTVLTHPKTNHVLPGITRDVVLQLAADAGHPVEQRPVQVEELESVDELFLTGTTTEVRPVTELDGRPVGDGSPGPLTRELFRGYRAAVGRG